MDAILALFNSKKIITAKYLWIVLWSVNLLSSRSPYMFIVLTYFNSQYDAFQDILRQCLDITLDSIRYLSCNMEN